MSIGMALIPVGDAIAKYLSAQTSYSPLFLAWSRFLLGACIMLPLALHGGRIGSLTGQFYKRQCLRGLLIALTVVCIIKAVSMSPIAEVFGAFFIGPVLSVVLSVFLLKEKASTTDWVSVVLGFVGVLLVVQPDFIGFSGAGVGLTVVQKQGLYWALLAGVFYGAFLVATRWASGIGPPLAQVSMQFIVATLLLSPFGVLEAMQLGIVQLPLLVLMGATSVLANYFSILGLARATAATLAPVVYMQVVAATLIGVYVFNHSLGLLAMAGITIIVLSGLFRIRIPSGSAAN